MKRKLKVLFYGLTHEHAHGKLMTLAKLTEDFEIVAAVDDRAETKGWFANEPASAEGLPVVAADEAFRRDDIDVVFVEMTNARLMEVAAMCLERGLPMHCDKPCGEAMEPYRTLVAEAQAKNLPFQIGYMYRGNPAIRWIWKSVSEGLLGDVTFVEADMNHDYQLDGYPEYIGSFGGGIFYNLGCHLVDMVLPLVCGEFRSAVPMIGPAPGDPPDAKTSASVFLRFAGTDVLLRTSSHLPGGIGCRRLRVDGTKGTIDLCPIERFDGEELKLTLSLKGEPQRTVGFGVQTDRYADQLLDLAAILRGEKANDQDYARDLAVHEMTLRACGCYGEGLK